MDQTIICLTASCLPGAGQRHRQLHKGAAWEVAVRKGARTFGRLQEVIGIARVL